MAPFSISELKGRANVSDLKKRVGDGYASTRDKYASTSSKNPGYNPPRRGESPRSSVEQPPPPPSRSSIDPPPSRLSAAPAYEETEEPNRIDWANLSEEDKQVFFGWLDEFFSRYTGKPIPSFAPANPASAPLAPKPVLAAPALPRRTTSTSDASSSASASPAPPPMPARRGTAQTAAPAMPPRQSSSGAEPTPPPPRRNLPPPVTGPPKLNLSTRPSAPSRAPSSTPDGDPTVALRMTFPPLPVHGSNAADLAQYFSSSNPWGPNDTWYNSPSPIPPMPAGVPQSQTRWAAGTSSNGREVTLSASLVFADLSACYYKVTYPAAPHAPADPRVRRQAWYTLRPAALQGGALVAAHSAYGEAIAAFAESYAGTGRFVARGECWDLAQKALEAAAARAPGDAPVPSISRCHGHLIYCGRPGEGRWRGGDGCVRRGDVVEWRKVRIESARGWSSLGDPDHTAVIVRDCVPLEPVADGSALAPAELGEITVVEQSVGSPPKMETYALEGMTQGEVWIYRPICMRQYVGFEFEVEPAAGAPVIAV